MTGDRYRLCGARRLPAFVLAGLIAIVTVCLDAQEQTTPLRQAGTPEQMAEAVIFFLTSASNITGEFLIVDAGTHLGGLPMKGR